MATIVTRSGKGSPLSVAEGDANFTNLNNDKIELTDLSVSTAAGAETSALAYNNTTGVFTFTPVSTSDLIALTDLSVGTEGSASGNGSIAYNNSTGVFTYTPPTAGGIGAISSTAPQLGANLDVGTYNITTSTLNGDVQIAPNGTGTVDLNGQTKVNGNLTITSGNAIRSLTDQDLTLQALGTGSVVLTGTQVEVGQPVLAFPNGYAKIAPATGQTIDLSSDSILLGESSSSTEVLITTAASSNANLKIRAAGTGVIIVDDPMQISGGDLDMTNKKITTTTTNGIIEIENNGTGSTVITGGAGLAISTGYVSASGTDADLTLSANGTGVIVLNQAGGVVVTDTGASGLGVITGATSKGVALLTNAGAQNATDPQFSLASGGGATLSAGSGSTLTLTGNALSVTGTTTFNNAVTIDGDADINSLNNFTHALSVESSVSGTYAPDASTGNVKYIIPSGNITINDFAAGSIIPGQTISLLIDQSSYSTSYTLTLGAKFLVPGGTAPALTATGNDLISFLCLDDGSVSGGNVYIANIVNDYQ